MTPVAERVPCPPHSALNAVGVATALGATLAESGRRTMGLLLSDTVLIDPLLDDAAWLRHDLGAWAYTPDIALDPYEHEGADPME